MTEDSNLLWTGYSVNGVLIRLTRERWEHIVTEHPEMQGHYNQILETLENPDLIQRDDSTGALLALRFYAEIPENKNLWWWCIWNLLDTMDLLRQLTSEDSHHQVSQLYGQRKDSGRFHKDYGLL